MYIRNINLKDFCNVHFQALTDLPDAVALFGMNGNGKTTVLYAIQMLLFGFCDRTTKAGAGADCLIRDGAKQAEISCDIEINPETTLQVWATIKRRGSNEWGVVELGDGVCPDGVTNREELWRHLGKSMRHATVAAFPAQMLRSKDLGDILADYLAGDIDQSLLRLHCGANFDWMVEFAKKKGIALSDAKTYEHLGSTAFDVRKGLKKEVQEARAVLDANLTYERPKDATGAEIPVASLPKIEQQVAGIQGKLDVLLEQLGAAKATPTAEGIDAERVRLQANVDDANAAAVTAVDALEAIRAEHTARTEEFQSAERAYGDAKQKALAPCHEIEMAKRALNEIQKPDGKCPTCKQEITEAVAAVVIAPLKEQIKTLTATQKQLAKVESEALSTVSSLRDVIKQVRERQEAAETTRNNTARALAAAQGELAGIPAAYTGESADAIQAKIDALREQKTRGEAAVAGLQKLAKNAADEKYIANAEAEIERLDWCVRSFKDGEILKQLIGPPLAEFAKRCNSELAPMGYELSIISEGKQLQPWLKCPGSPTARPVSQCSQGQQTLACIAIASAFADLGGPVLIDDLNHLDADNRRRVLARMRAKSAGSVICATTWQMPANADLAPVAAALAPLATYWAKDGTYTAVAAAEKAAA